MRGRLTRELLAELSRQAATVQVEPEPSAEPAKAEAPTQPRRRPDASYAALRSEPQPSRADGAGTRASVITHDTVPTRAALPGVP